MAKSFTIALATLALLATAPDAMAYSGGRDGGGCGSCGATSNDRDEGYQADQAGQFMNRVNGEKPATFGGPARGGSNNGGTSCACSNGGYGGGTTTGSNGLRGGGV